MKYKKINEAVTFKENSLLNVFPREHLFIWVFLVTSLILASYNQITTDNMKKNISDSNVKYSKSLINKKQREILFKRYSQMCLEHGYGKRDFQVDFSIVKNFQHNGYSVPSYIPLELGLRDQPKFRLKSGIVVGLRG